LRINPLEGVESQPFQGFHRLASDGAGSSSKVEQATLKVNYGTKVTA
jgi:hypothetical protein